MFGLVVCTNCMYWLYVPVVCTRNGMEPEPEMLLKTDPS